MMELDKYSELELLIGLFYGESRLIESSIADDIIEILAIGGVVLNRVRSPHFPNTIKEVILQPNQFSCFNEDDPNRNRLTTFLNDKFLTGSYHKYEVYATALLNNLTLDFSRGATHYTSIAFYEKAKPTHWCRKMRVTMLAGGHIFMEEVSL